MRDPHCTRNVKAAILKAQRLQLKSAAAQQRREMTLRRTREYTKSMRAAATKSAIAALEHSEEGKWLPAGRWLPLSTPSTLDHSHTRPPSAHAGPGDVPALLSGLARGSPRARTAILNQIAIGRSAEGAEASQPLLRTRRERKTLTGARRGGAQHGGG